MTWIVPHGLKKFIWPENVLDKTPEKMLKKKTFQVELLAPFLYFQAKPFNITTILFGLAIILSNLTRHDSGFDRPSQSSRPARTL